MAAGRLVDEAALHPIRQQKSNGNRTFGICGDDRQLESPLNRPLIFRSQLGVVNIEAARVFIAAVARRKPPELETNARLIAIA
jgi:hypothetical protein